ncbi:MAG: carboxypeptidase regulatory-like domain-containing protein, partial [Bacteroidales bacterium]|nr:carboxypeptidase regulatory-like domain-containing protein [Bacteroidales bacterium]
NEEISISGIAREAASGSSLSGIKIVLLHDGLTEQDTTTSADGEFHFSIEPGGSYALLASKEGYQNKSFIIPANYSEGGDRIDLSMKVLEEVENKLVEELVAEVVQEAEVEIFAKETIPEPEDKPVNSALSENQVDSAMNISFSVQIGAYKKRVSSTTVSRYTKASENLPLRQYKDSRGYTLFQVGSFKEFQDADQVLQTLLERSIKEAFVIAYCNQERIQVTRARILTKDIFPQSDHEQQNYTTDHTSPESLKTDIH